MLNQEQIMQINALNKHGHSIRQLAQSMGVSRNTVRRYLRGASSERAKPTNRQTKLKPYETYLTQRVQQARPDWISGTVLLREIQARGYLGGLTMVKQFIRGFKPAPKADPVVRFETEPGHQMQADFVVFRRGQDPLLAFVATMGFSRASFVLFSQTETHEAWAAGLRAAFEFFGGVPREVLFDNAKAIVIDRDHYGKGKHQFHTGMAELANAYGFAPRLCRPYRARTKGKVERFNRYFRHQFYIPLATQFTAIGLTLDVISANIEVKRWLHEVANTRVHKTTGHVPAQQLLLEQPCLIGLPVLIPQTPSLPSANAVPMPSESIQHPLSVYTALVEVAV
jgi:transposase